MCLEFLRQHLRWSGSKASAADIAGLSAAVSSALGWTFAEKLRHEHAAIVERAVEKAGGGDAATRVRTALQEVAARSRTAYERQVWWCNA